MKRFKARQTHLLFILIMILSVFLITGCGGGGEEGEAETGHWLPTDNTAPTVNSTVPANLATNVTLNSQVTATFSEPMDPLTITTTTFTLKQGATAVSGTVTYSDVTAVFTPTTILAASTTYTATITTGAEDLAGNQLAGNQAPWPAASNYVWSFTTGAAPDTTRPTVTLTVPANGATGVLTNTKVSATFSEAMDPLTITNLIFTLKQGATAVPGTVNYSGVTAVFTPAASLAASTTYTATITTGAKDLAGNALASDYVWSFTTGAAPDTTRPTVIFTVPANGATGVLTNTKVSATFSEAMDPLTITNLIFTLKQGATAVPGTVIYSGVTAVFTPAASLAASTTYTATITTGAKDLAGNALASDYVWSFTTGAAPDTTRPTVIFTVPANGATGVLTNTKVSATFSEVMDPLTITNLIFTLKQGATAVPGTVIYSGVTAVFTPAASLAASTTYTATITTGATDLAGNALASDYVWSFTTGAAPDTTRPTVIFTVPANGATGVLTNTKISATFSEAMDPLTITTITFTVKQGATAVPGTVIYSGVTAVFTPAASLAASTTYTATITTGAKDLAGNALASDYVWSFTTGTALDTTRPTVIRTFPANLATNVALNSQVTATFSEPMDPLTITTMTFTLTAPGLVWSTTVTYFGVTAVLTPYSNLNASTTYTATITSMATDLAGNQLAGNQAPLPAASNYVWTFTTGVSVVPPVSPAACAAGPLPLGSAATFGVLAGTAFTVANPTSVTGDVGSPSITPAVGPSTLVGTKYDTASGSLALIAAAVTDMQIAAACANGRSCDVNYGAIDLGGLSLGPGVYCATGAINITGTLSLNAPGVYIFRTANTFNTAANAIVQFTAPATAANTSVYWVPVGATTLGANTKFIGNIMASSAAITVSAVSTVTSGSALSGSAVTVNTSTIAIP